MDIKSKLRDFGGVNPPYAPPYSTGSLKWEKGKRSAVVRNLELITRVEGRKIDELLECTPFDRVNERVAFRFLLSSEHYSPLPPIIAPEEEMFDLMVTVPVRFQGLLAFHHLYMYCSDTGGTSSGRELHGYSKKDCTHRFRESIEGNIDGWVDRRKKRLAAFSFVPSASAVDLQLVDGEQQPHGELHVRRFAHPSSPEPAYADIIYRNFAPDYSAYQIGHATMNLENLPFDPLKDLAPEILAAHVSHTSNYGVTGEKREILARFLNPSGPSPL